MSRVTPESEEYDDWGVRSSLTRGRRRSEDAVVQAGACHPRYDHLVVCEGVLSTKLRNQKTYDVRTVRNGLVVLARLIMQIVRTLGKQTNHKP